MPWLTGSNLIGAVVGFLAGALGYVIIKHWVLPIVGYKTLKRRIGQDMNRYVAAAAAHPAGRDQKKAVGRSLRNRARALAESFHHELPQWYRIMLQSRGEKPVDASQVLTRMANTTDRAHMRGQVEQIRASLKL
jgi:hypothetical protein